MPKANASSALESAANEVEEQPRYINTAKKFEITDRRTSGLSQVFLVLARTGRMSPERSGLGDRAAAAVPTNSPAIFTG